MFCKAFSCESGRNGGRGWERRHQCSALAFFELFSLCMRGRFVFFGEFWRLKHVRHACVSVLGVEQNLAELEMNRRENHKYQFFLPVLDAKFILAM